MKAFLLEAWQSLRATLKWLLIIAAISGTGIVVAVVYTQWAAYQHAANQVAQQAAEKAAKGGAQ